jgi:hypothetical protein
MKKRTAFILVCLMVISPIVSAIDHCAGMHGMNAVQQLDLSMTVSVMSMGADDHQTMAETAIDCSDAGECALHLCSGHAVMLSITAFNFVISTGFQQSVILALYNSPSFAAIRPPISIL